MAEHESSGQGHGQLQCVVVTPEATVLDAMADFVALPLYDGELGVAPGRSPLIGRLGYGELRVRTAGSVARYYVDGGFVQVRDNVVSVLTNRAIPAESINTHAASEQLIESRHRAANTPDLMAIRDRLEQQARAQLRVARHSGTTVEQHAGH